LQSRPPLSRLRQLHCVAHLSSVPKLQPAVPLHLGAIPGASTEDDLVFAALAR
jgi:hypothetical protein